MDPLFDTSVGTDLGEDIRQTRMLARANNQPEIEALCTKALSPGKASDRAEAWWHALDQLENLAAARAAEAWELLQDVDDAEEARGY